MQFTALGMEQVNWPVTVTNTSRKQKTLRVCVQRLQPWGQDGVTYSVKPKKLFLHCTRFKTMNKYEFSGILLVSQTQYSVKDRQVNTSHCHF